MENAGFWFRQKKVKSYAEAPEMSADEITDKVVESMRLSDESVIIVNYANADLVGHSGDLQATIKAVEKLDECISKVYDAAREFGYVLVITADHGNADDMLYENGDAKLSHSMNKVIFLIADSGPLNLKNLKSGRGLSDVAPTLLDIIGLDKPKDMSGESLIIDQ